jgi:hypothetical protein
MNKQPVERQFPPRIHTVENGKTPNEGVFISWEEHEATLSALREENQRKIEVLREALEELMNGKYYMLNNETMAFINKTLEQTKDE